MLAFGSLIILQKFLQQCNNFCLLFRQASI
uniref:Uncharacterized protein n=1 Tax=Arundo donax TaxID=35708 RepID=A0A0A9CIV6_ARUDO